ncbi:uncharacterized protein IUM83_17350 [Phytophthora cinnamomi]|uniref:uncharacterized protein n=1 Tax=Phytophthora cinnamomi TaxID=4785 RepID=UPI0035595C97|nr:hypothetical protein IUM83_17350 [Phytophthora cinnamomi]
MSSKCFNWSSRTGYIRVRWSCFPWTKHARRVSPESSWNGFVGSSEANKHTGPKSAGVYSAFKGGGRTPSALRRGVFALRQQVLPVCANDIKSLGVLVGTP